VNVGPPYRSGGDQSMANIVRTAVMDDLRTRIEFLLPFRSYLELISLSMWVPRNPNFKLWTVKATPCSNDSRHSPVMSTHLLKSSRRNWRLEGKLSASADTPSSVIFLQPTNDSCKCRNSFCGKRLASAFRP